MNVKKDLMCLHCSPATHHTDVDSLSKHLFDKHRTLASVKCGKCKKDFLHKSSLIRHISAVHESEREEENSSSSSSASGSPQPAQAIRVQVDNDSMEAMDDTNSNNPNDTEVEACSMGDMFTAKEPKLEASLFLMNLRTSGNLTHTSIKFIQEHVDKLVASVLMNAGIETTKFLEECDILKEKYEPFVQQTFDKGNIFEGLYTVEDQLNFFANEYGMVIPEDKYIGSRIENRYDREKRMFLPAQVLETYQYTSLTDTLKIVVRNPYLRGLIEKEQQSSDGVYRSYKDGTDHKTNSFLKKHPNAIRIVLYQDDLEVANALGSKDTIHKLGCFYFSIQNFPPEESSLLASIFLLALCYAEDLKKNGCFTKVLTPFKEELKLLMTDKGIEVDLPDGEKYVLRACLVNFCDDTLAAHAILGLLGPSATKFCRLFMISKEDYKEDSCAIGRLRECRSHKQQIEAVQKNTKAAPLYGVREKPILMEMMKVPRDAPFDMFHDLVGIIEMDLKLVLHEFICVRKLFSAYQFNSNLNTFDYGKPDAKNKSSPNCMRKKLMAKGHSLKQYGSQSFCLLRIFPFVVTGVEASDVYMQLIYLLQDIVKILFTFELQEDDVVKLESLICEHNKLFHQIFISQEVTGVQENAAEAGETEAEEDEEVGEEGADNDGEEEDGEEEDDNDEEEEEEQEEDDEEEVDNPSGARRRRKKRKKVEN